jgi:hypothetical protein
MRIDTVGIEGRGPSCAIDYMHGLDYSKAERVSAFSMLIDGQQPNDLPLLFIALREKANHLHAVEDRNSKLGDFLKQMLVHHDGCAGTGRGAARVRIVIRLETGIVPVTVMWERHTQMHEVMETCKREAGLDESDVPMHAAPGIEILGHAACVVP